MNTKTIASIVLVIVVALGTWWFFTKGPTLPILGQQEMQNTSRLPYTKTPEGDRKYTEETDTYRIEATYPEVANAAMQAAVEAAIKAEIGRFKSDIAVMITEEEAQRIREFGRPYEFSIAYKPYQSKDFVSYEFDIYIDTGGAHPNGFFHTLTLNAEGREVELADLFVSNAPYLERISREAYTQVLAQLTERSNGEVSPDMEDTVRIGTSPTPETLQFFVLDGDSLVILIPPYQAASYAAGTFTVNIPLANLSDILKPTVL